MDLDIRDVDRILMLVCGIDTYHAAGKYHVTIVISITTTKEKDHKRRIGGKTPA